MHFYIWKLISLWYFIVLYKKQGVYSVRFAHSVIKDIRKMTSSPKTFWLQAKPPHSWLVNGFLLINLFSHDICQASSTLCSLASSFMPEENTDVKMVKWAVWGIYKRQNFNPFSKGEFPCFQKRFNKIYKNCNGVIHFNIEKTQDFVGGVSSQQKALLWDYSWELQF